MSDGPVVIGVITKQLAPLKCADPKCPFCIRLQAEYDRYYNSSAADIIIHQQQL